MTSSSWDCHVFVFAREVDHREHCSYHAVLDSAVEALFRSPLFETEVPEVWGEGG